MLREIGALVKEEPYQNNVGYSERADVPIEPRLSEQWFLKYPSVQKRTRMWSPEGEHEVSPRALGEGLRPLDEQLQDWCI